MMIDALNEFSDAQAVTTTTLSTNVIDMHAGTDNPTRDIGAGEPVYVVVMTSSTATGPGTLTVTLESATDAAITSNVTVHVATAALATAVYGPAGTYLLAVRLPIGEYRRYLAVRYTASAALTGGTFDAFITHDITKFRAYADRQPISAGA